jgi:hypothetical protein
MTPPDELDCFDALILGGLAAYYGTALLFIPSALVRQYVTLLHRVQQAARRCDAERTRRKNLIAQITLDRR